MKWINASFIYVCFAVLFASCSQSEKPPVVSVSMTQNTEIPQNSQFDTNVNNDSGTHQNSISVNEMAVTVLSSGQLIPAYSLFGGQNAVECSGNIYFYDGGGLRTIDRESGSIRCPCRDPLCKHTDCVNALEVRSIISDGKSIYIKGIVENTSVFSVSGGSKWTEFVGVYNPKQDTFHFLDRWPGESGNSSSAIRLYDESLYYLRRHSDTTNSLYRVQISGGNAERITLNNEFVIDFCVFEDRIHYRDSAFTHKSISLESSGRNDVRIEGENICVIFADGDGFFTISSSPVEKDKYAVMRNGIPLPDLVYAPAAVMKSGHSLWYTMSENTSIPYTDENGVEKTTISPNGTKLYQYDLSTGERIVYDIALSYGVAPNAFNGIIGDWLFLNVCNPDRLIVQAFANTHDTTQYTVLYEN